MTGTQLALPLDDRLVLDIANKEGVPVTVPTQLMIYVYI